MTIGPAGGGDTDSLPAALTGAGNFKVSIQENAGNTPAAGTLSVIATSGTAVTLFSGPCNGGFVTNPPNLAAQGIAAAEPAYIDMVGTPGSTDAAANGTTTYLDTGQSFTVPPLAAGVAVKANAATSGHKLTVVKW
jgi:hypothetical protein